MSDKPVHYVMQLMIVPNVYKLVYACNQAVKTAIERTTIDVEKVTCKNCLKIINKEKVL